MTKKMKEAIETLEMRYGLEVFMFKSKVNSREEAINHIKDLRTGFNDFRRQGYRFGFVSLKDFKETKNLAYDLSINYLDEILNED